MFRQFGEVPDWRHYYRNLYKPQAPGWLATQKALADFATEAKKIDARLLVFNIPELRELKPYPFTDITDKVRKVVEAQGVPFTTCCRAWKSLTPSTLWVTMPDPHPNANAMTAMARDMCPASCRGSTNSAAPRARAAERPWLPGPRRSAGSGQSMRSSCSA